MGWKESHDTKEEESSHFLTQISHLTFIFMARLLQTHTSRLTINTFSPEFHDLQWIFRLDSIITFEKIVRVTSIGKYHDSHL